METQIGVLVTELKNYFAQAKYIRTIQFTPNEIEIVFDDPVPLKKRGLSRFHKFIKGLGFVKTDEGVIRSKFVQNEYVLVEEFTLDKIKMQIYYDVDYKNRYYLKNITIIEGAIPILS